MDLATMKNQIRAAYDKDAERRADKEYKIDAWKLPIRQKFVDLLKQEQKNSILELGAGVGLDSQFFIDQGFKVLATDISEGMVSACKAANISARILDIYEVDQLVGTFDAIYSMNVLLHVPKNDLKQILEKLSKKLAPGGIFFLGVYGEEKDEEIMINDKEKMGLPRFFSFLSDQTIVEIVKEVFDVIEFESVIIPSKTPGFHFQSLLLRKKC